VRQLTGRHQIVARQRPVGRPAEQAGRSPPGVGGLVDPHLPLVGVCLLVVVGDRDVVLADPAVAP
jgi:hypothetical protein